MFKRGISAIALLLLAAGLATGQGKFKSKKHGFSLSVPTNFREIPIRTGEKWILAKWQSKRPFYWTDPKGFSTEHRPMLRVMSFPHNIQNVKKEGTGGTEVTTIDFPYRNYRDYLKRNHQGGGWFISKEKTIKVKGEDVTYLEINIEKLSNTPKYIWACIYTLNDRDLAVEVDVLKNQVKKLKPALYRTLKSLRTFKRDGSVNTHADVARPTGLVISFGDGDLDKKYQERQRAWKQRILSDARKNLPKGWKKLETKNFLVITHASPKETKRFLNLAKSMRKWLDKSFKGVGNGEVIKSVIRICADSDEENAYRSGSGDNFSWDTGEVVCSAGRDFMGWSISSLSQALAQQYFSDKNPSLWRALPWWISSGLSNYIGNARVTKRKGFTFLMEPRDIIRLRKLIDEKRLISVRDLMTKSQEELRTGRVEGYQDVSTLGGTLVRFLLEGPGRKGRTKGLLVNAMTQAAEILEKEDKDAWKSSVTSKMNSKTPMTEEEEEEEWKKRKERSKEWSSASEERRRKFYSGIHDKLFEGWGAAEWSKLEKDFVKYLRKIAKR